MYRVYYCVTIVTHLHSTIHDTKHQRNFGRLKHQRASVKMMSTKSLSFQLRWRYPVRFKWFLPWYCCILLLFLVGCDSVDAAAVTEPTNHQEICTLKTECRECTRRDKETIPECKSTGKIAAFTCVTVEKGDEKTESRRKIESCRRTRTDEDYLMVQLQIICLLVGSFTFMTVKRQRQLHASGFDQRKESFYSNYSRNTNNNNVDRSSTPEERAPLADDEDSGIEVV